MSDCCDPIKPGAGAPALVPQGQPLTSDQLSNPSQASVLMGSRARNRPRNDYRHQPVEVTSDGAIKISIVGAIGWYQGGVTNGNGNVQNFAHGLGAVPDIVFAIPTNTLVTNAYTLVAGSHNATHIAYTATSGLGYIPTALRLRGRS